MKFNIAIIILWLIVGILEVVLNSKTDGVLYLAIAIIILSHIEIIKLKKDKQEG